MAHGHMSTTTLPSHHLDTCWHPWNSNNFIAFISPHYKQQAVNFQHTNSCWRVFSVFSKSTATKAEAAIPLTKLTASQYMKGVKGFVTQILVCNAFPQASPHAHCPPPEISEKPWKTMICSDKGHFIHLKRHVRFFQDKKTFYGFLMSFCQRYTRFMGMKYPSRF